MGLKIEAKLECDGDGCSEVIRSRVEVRSTMAASTVWEVKRLAKQRGWLEVNRGRYYTRTFYCPACSDKPMKPVPRQQATVENG